MASVPVDLQWQIIRKNSCFIRRQRGIPKHFSTEKFNLKGVNSIKYNGLINKRGVNIEPAADGKGITVTVKVKDQTTKPARSTATSVLTKDSRRCLKSVKNIVKTYDSRHVRLAQLRASQLLRSLKPGGRRNRRMHKVEA
ncbi:hypothetical protein AB6A40_005244 [Gnathostoma spinigerum]|uniref:Large ribosomal subunit protein eL28 n=1 Tax=Gnathostoma spinigerum TaxID=75299 RepID=A0ABD6EG03_9BILA